MSVVLEKFKIVITLDTGNTEPDEDLMNLQKNLLRLLSNQNEDEYQNNYWVYNFLEEILLDRKSFTGIDNDFNVTPINELLYKFNPEQLVQSLIKAKTYLFKYATTLEGRSVQVEDIARDLTKLEEAIGKGIRIVNKD